MPPAVAAVAIPAAASIVGGIMSNRAAGKQAAAGQAAAANAENARQQAMQMLGPQNMGQVAMQLFPFLFGGQTAPMAMGQSGQPQANQQMIPAGTDPYRLPGWWPTAQAPQNRGSFASDISSFMAPVSQALTTPATPATPPAAQTAQPAAPAKATARPGAGARKLPTKRQPPSKGGGGRTQQGPKRQGPPYIVGEKGPELFVPAQNGMVLPMPPGPNRQFGGGVMGGMMNPFQQMPSPLHGFTPGASDQPQPQAPQPGGGMPQRPSKARKTRPRQGGGGGRTQQGPTQAAGAMGPGVPGGPMQAAMANPASVFPGRASGGPVFANASGVHQPVPLEAANQSGLPQFGMGGILAGLNEVTAARQQQGGAQQPQAAQAPYANYGATPQSPGEYAVMRTMEQLANPGQTSTIGYERTQEQANQGLVNNMLGITGGLSGRGFDVASPMGQAMMQSAVQQSTNTRAQGAREQQLLEENLRRTDTQQGIQNYLNMLASMFGYMGQQGAAASGTQFPQVTAPATSPLASGVTAAGDYLGRYFAGQPAASTPYTGMGSQGYGGGQTWLQSQGSFAS